ncbi:transglutaminase-like cysteine peptidase [Candidatus Gracilibacteria bacterium]|nr:transglutaminase-like cysteine peptidase [Candidatus Gracilibacteria bacterium]
MQVRAILDQKGLPRRTVRLSSDRRARLFVDGEIVVGIEHGEGGATVRIYTDRSGMFILTKDYEQFIAEECTPFELAFAI